MVKVPSWVAAGANQSLFLGERAREGWPHIPQNWESWAQTLDTARWSFLSSPGGLAESPRSWEWGMGNGGDFVSTPVAGRYEDGSTLDARLPGALGRWIVCTSVPMTASRLGALHRCSALVEAGHGRCPLLRAPDATPLLSGWKFEVQISERSKTEELFGLGSGSRRGDG